MGEHSALTLTYPEKSVYRTCTVFEDLWKKNTQKSQKPSIDYHDISEKQTSEEHVFVTVKGLTMTITLNAPFEESLAPLT